MNEWDVHFSQLCLAVRRAFFLRHWLQICLIPMHEDSCATHCITLRISCLDQSQHTLKSLETWSLKPSKLVCNTVCGPLQNIQTIPLRHMHLIHCKTFYWDFTGDPYWSTKHIFFKKIFYYHVLTVVWISQRKRRLLIHNTQLTELHCTVFWYNTCVVS